MSLAEALAGHTDDYDLVLIDCPPNLGLLPVGLATFGVPLQATRVAHADLTGDVLSHHRRNLARIRQETPKESHRRELNREPEPVVIVVARRDEREIVALEAELTCEVLS